MLVIFEGIEGAGKTTHINLMAKELRAQGFPVVVETQEPGWRADQLSGILKHLIGTTTTTPVEKLFFLLADRAGHYSRFIRPEMNENRFRPIILCERGPDSTIAYQGFGMNLMPPVDLHNMNLLATNGIRAHITFILDAHIDTALPRSSRSGELDLVNQNVRDYYSRVQDGYKHVADADPIRYMTVDTAQDTNKAHVQCLNEVLRRVKL